MVFTVTTDSHESLGILHEGSVGNPGTVTWPAANRIIFEPVRLRHKGILRGMFVKNGSAVSGNLDVGVFSPGGTRIASKGSTAQSGASAIQNFDLTDVVLLPGLYYMAMQLDNTTGRTTCWQPAYGVSMNKAAGVRQASPGSFPLPVAATFETQATNVIPQMGLTLDLLDPFRVEPLRPAGIISPWSLEALSTVFITAGGDSGLLNMNTAAVWPAANRAIYVPFRMETRETFRKCWWLNGATVGTNTVDVGVYNARSLARIANLGATTTSGVSVLQEGDIADFTIGPGFFYLAMLVNGTTDTFIRSSSVSALNLQYGGVLQEAVGAGTLPVTMTGATPASAYMPAFGISMSSLV